LYYSSCFLRTGRRGRTTTGRHIRWNLNQTGFANVAAGNLRCRRATTEMESTCLTFEWHLPSTLIKCTWPWLLSRPGTSFPPSESQTTYCFPGTAGLVAWESLAHHRTGAHAHPNSLQDFLPFRFLAALERLRKRFALCPHLCTYKELVVLNISAVFLPCIQCDCLLISL